MTARLTEADLAVIERRIGVYGYQNDADFQKLLAEVHALTAERDAAVALSRPIKQADEATTYTTPEHGWICFHCGETFPPTYGGQRAAAEHFGAHPDAIPGCHLRMQDGEKPMLRRIRWLESERDALQRRLDAAMQVVEAGRSWKRVRVALSACAAPKPNMKPGPIGP